MAPYDNLPRFRRWLEHKIGHTSKGRSDALILGDFIRYKLGEDYVAEVANFIIKYRGNSWKTALVLMPLLDGSALLKDEIIVELTDDAISSVIAQCAFNEGEVLNNDASRKRKN